MNNYKYWFIDLALHI